MSDRSLREKFETISAGRVVPVALLVLTVLVAAMTAWPVGGLVRLLLTVAFFLVAPGWAIIAVTPWEPRTSVRWASAIAVSVAIDLLVAQAMVLTGSWNPSRALAVMTGLTAALLTVHVIRGERR